MVSIDTQTYIITVAVAALVNLLLTFGSEWLRVNVKHSIAVIVASLPHFLIINVILILLLSKSDEAITKSLFSIPFGTINAILFLLVSTTSSVLMQSVTKYKKLITFFFVTIDLIIWFLLAFLWNLTINYLISNQPNITLFHYRLSSIILFGIILALCQFIIGSLFLCRKQMNIFTSDDRNTKTFGISELFSVLITILNGLILYHNYPIISGIIATFPVLQISLSDKLLVQDTVPGLFSCNIFVLCVAQFYLNLNAGIGWSICAAYCIVFALIATPLYYCLQYIHFKFTCKRLQYWYLEDDQEPFCINGATMSLYGSYATNSEAQTLSVGDV